MLHTKAATCFSVLNAQVSEDGANDLVQWIVFQVSDIVKGWHGRTCLDTGRPTPPFTIHPHIVILQPSYRLILLTTQAYLHIMSFYATASDLWSWTKSDLTGDLNQPVTMGHLLGIVAAGGLGAVLGRITPSVKTWFGQEREYDIESQEDHASEENYAGEKYGGREPTKSVRFRKEEEVIPDRASWAHEGDDDPSIEHGTSALPSRTGSVSTSTDNGRKTIRGGSRVSVENA